MQLPHTRRFFLCLIPVAMDSVFGFPQNVYVEMSPNPLPYPLHEETRKWALRKRLGDLVLTKESQVLPLDPHPAPVPSTTMPPIHQEVT